MKRPGFVRIGLAILPEQRRFTVKTNLASMLRLAERAGKLGCDLVAFEENGMHLFVPRSEKGCEIPGPETAKLSGIAARHQMYLAATMSEKTTNGFHNVVTLFDRSGAIQYIYRKQQLIDAEIKGGIIAGNENRPIQTDFGRIGFLICYDTQFPELMRTLAFRGVDLVICPHVGGAGQNAGKMVGSAFAGQNHCWLAWVGRYVTSFINPLGAEVAKLPEGETLLVADIELSRNRIVPQSTTFSLDWRGHQFTQIRPGYGGSSFPSVVVESPDMPLFTENALPSGRVATELRICNRSGERRSGTLRVEFPLRFHCRSLESQPYYVDQLYDENWLLSEPEFSFDLPPFGTESRTVIWDVPGGTSGNYLLRASGVDDQGDRVFWERQVSRLQDLPAPVRAPLIRQWRNVQTEGIRIPLEYDFFGSPVRSESEVRIARTNDEFVLWSRMTRYGAWKHEKDRNLEEFAIAFSHEEPKSLLFWLRINPNGAYVGQRRENGFQVRRPTPVWEVWTRASATGWETWIRLPFRELPGKWRPNPVWRFNCERHALIPSDIGRERAPYSIVAPRSLLRKKHENQPSRATEWACWIPHYTRLDNPARFGTLEME
jgi:predicted amidohydrolase